MQFWKYFTKSMLVVAALVACAIFVVTKVTTTTQKEQYSESVSSSVSTTQLDRLVLPLEGVIIKANTNDIEEYINAATQEEKDEILEKLLNNPDNTVISIEKSDPPSAGGDAVAHNN